MQTVIKIAYFANKFCLFHAPFCTGMACNGNIPSWLGPSLQVGDSIQAQGHFSCEYLPDHHWGSAVGKRKQKRQYQGINTRLWYCQSSNQQGRPSFLASELVANSSCCFIWHYVWKPPFLQGWELETTVSPTMVPCPRYGQPRLYAALMKDKGFVEVHSLCRGRTLAFFSIIARNAFNFTILLFSGDFWSELKEP